MALKNLPKVKHFILTGGVNELNFYLSDIMRQNPGYNLEKVVVLNAPKEAQYSLASQLSVLYIFVNPAVAVVTELPEVVEPVEKSKNGKEAVKVNA